MLLPVGSLAAAVPGGSRRRRDHRLSAPPRPIAAGAQLRRSHRRGSSGVAARVLERSAPEGAAKISAADAEAAEAESEAEAAACLRDDRASLQRRMDAAAATTAPHSDGAAAGDGATAAAASQPPPPLPPLAPLPGERLLAVDFDGTGFAAEVTRRLESGGAAGRQRGAQLEKKEQQDQQQEEKGGGDEDEEERGTYHVRVTGPSGADAMVLHWAVDDWAPPPPASVPAGSARAGDGRAARTPFALRPRSNAAADAAADIDSGATVVAAVDLEFDAAACPERLVFVVHRPATDEWARDHSNHFSVPLRPPRLEERIEGVLEAEASAPHWGLLHRLQRSVELFAAAADAPPSEAAGGGSGGSGGLDGARAMAFVYAWLRLSADRQLAPARAFSYQPRDVAWAQRRASEAAARAARCARDPAARAYARALLASALSRGGDGGDDIRHGILNLMRDFGIAEGNRPVRRGGGGGVLVVFPASSALARSPCRSLFPPAPPPLPPTPCRITTHPLSLTSNDLLPPPLYNPPPSPLRTLYFTRRASTSRGSSSGTRRSTRPQASVF